MFSKSKNKQKILNIIVGAGLFLTLPKGYCQDLTLSEILTMKEDDRQSILRLIDKKSSTVNPTITIVYNMPTNDIKAVREAQDLKGSIEEIIGKPVRTKISKTEQAMIDASDARRALLPARRFAGDY